jgi:hypothetical protein
MTETKQVADRLGDDLLNGVPAISQYLREKEWETRWHIRQGHYDSAVFRTGKMIRARKSLLDKLLSPKGMTAVILVAVTVSVTFGGLV